MGSKFSVVRVLRITEAELCKWLFNARMIVMFAMIVFMWSFAVDPLIGLSREMGSPLNFIEPFIAVFNSRTLCLITPAVYVFLVSDYPHLDRSSLFILHRVRKREWLAGQFLFFILSSFIFMGLIFLCTAIPNLISSFAANGWSLVVTRYAAFNPDRAHSFAATLIKKELYNQIAPYQAAAISFLLNWMYMVLLGTILLMFHVLNLRKFGVPALVSIIGIGSALGVFRSSGMWCFPMAHTMISLHYTEYLKKPIMELCSSFLYFGAVTTIVLIVSLIAVKRTNFLNIDDNE